VGSVELDPLAGAVCPAPRSLASYHRAALTFHYCDPLGAFTHNFDRDPQLAIVWEATPSSGSPDVAAHIRSEFEILAEWLVEWSPQHARKNLARLQLVDGGPATRSFTSRGCPTFRVLVVEDRDRRYGYSVDAAGRPRLVNLRCADLVRSTGCMADGAAALHLTDTPAEFFRQATLLLGAGRVDRSLGGIDDDGAGTLRQDLAGADGWASLAELFAVIRKTSSYAVLRSSGQLTEQRPAELGDIDLLCDDPGELAAAVNAVKTFPDPYNASHLGQVSGEQIRLDLHYVGDGYYDERWQGDLLRRAQLQPDGVVVPRVDDHFFSLLYHVHVHKSRVAEHHASTLASLGTAIGLRGFGVDSLRDEVGIARLLSGYLSSCGYTFSRPMDRAVLDGVNRRFVATLASVGPLPPGSHRFTRRQVLLRSVTRSRFAGWFRAHPQLRSVARRLQRLLLRLGF
jgi:hypothetical protein